MSRFIMVLDLGEESARPYLGIDVGGDDRGPEVVCEATNYWGDQITKALNEAPRVEELEAELRRVQLLHERARAEWAARYETDAALRACADNFARYGNRAPVVLTDASHAAANGGVAHACPEGDASVTPCCGRSPFDLPSTDQIVTTDDLVTCSPKADGQ